MTFEMYPMHVHRPGGQFKVVTSDAERDAALAAGWSLTPGEAVAPPVVEDRAAAPVMAPEDEISQAPEPKRGKKAKPSA